METSKSDNIQNALRHQFLNDVFFGGGTGYIVKEVGNWVLVRQPGGQPKISIYTRPQYEKYASWAIQRRNKSTMMTSVIK